MDDSQHNMSGGAMKDLKLHDAEYRFACIVWDHEPINSGELTKLCEKEMNWKRTTTYTVLKKLCDKGIFQNKNTLVTSLIKKEQIQRYESNHILEKVFDNSLPAFLTAFMSGKKLSQEEAEKLKKLIDEHKE